MTKMTQTLKRGDRIEYRFAGGKIVQGVITGHHAGFLDDGWYVVRLTDEGGTSNGSVHINQLRRISNR